MLAARLAADAEWLWYEPSECDCRGRDTILGTLAKRHRQGSSARSWRFASGQEVRMRWFAEPMERDFHVPDDLASVVVSVRDGRIIRMRDCRDHADAFAAAVWQPLRRS